MNMNMNINIKCVFVAVHACLCKSMNNKIRVEMAYWFTDRRDGGVESCEEGSRIDDMAMRSSESGKARGSRNWLTWRRRKFMKIKVSKCVSEAKM